MLDYITWICQVDANSIITNHPSISGGTTKFIFSNRSKSSAYGVSNQNVFDVDFEFDDVDLSIDDIILNPLAKASELRFSISALGAWYTELCEINGADDSLFVNYRVRLWATDCLVPGLVANLASPTGWVDFDGNNIIFTPTQAYTKTDSTYLLFDGVIGDISSGLNRTIFNAEADNILRGKTIGNLVLGRENKIAPILIGDMTDDNAFIPAVFPNDTNTPSALICADGVNVDGLYLYSSSAERYWKAEGNPVQANGVLYGMDTGASGTLTASIGGTGGGDSSQDVARGQAIEDGQPFFYAFGSAGSTGFEVSSECGKKDANKSRVYDLNGTGLALPYSQGQLDATYAAKAIEVSRGVYDTTASVRNAGASWISYVTPRSAFFTIAGELKPLSIALQNGYDIQEFPETQRAFYSVVANASGPFMSPPLSATYSYIGYNPTTQTAQPAPVSVSGDWRNFLARTTIGFHSNPLILSVQSHPDWNNTAIKTCASMFATKMSITWEAVGFNGVVSSCSILSYTRALQVAFPVAGLSAGAASLSELSYGNAPSFYALQMSAGYGGTTFPPSANRMVQGIWAVYKDNTIVTLTQDQDALTEAERITQSHTLTDKITSARVPANLEVSDLANTFLVGRGVGWRYPYPDSGTGDNNLSLGRTFSQQTYYELHYLRQFFKARVEAKEGQIFSRGKTHTGGATLSQAITLLGVANSVDASFSGAFASGILIDSPKPLVEVLRSIVVERTNGFAIADRNLFKVGLLGSGAVAKTFDASNILLAGDNLPDIDWSTTPKRELVTKVQVRYRRDHSRSTYARSIVLAPSGATASHANVSTPSVSSVISGLFLTYNKIGEGKTLTYDCDFIRDDDSAVRLATYLGAQLSQPRYSVTLKTHLKEVVNLAFGAKVKIELQSLPTRLASADFVVTGLNFNSSTEVSVTLQEVF